MSVWFFRRVVPALFCLFSVTVFLFILWSTPERSVRGLGLTPTVNSYLPNMVSAPPTSTFTPTPTRTPTPSPTSPPPANVQIVFIYYDPPGPDEDGEYVSLNNLGGTNATMTNWTLEDNANHVFTFPTFTLASGGSVKVWTGSGNNNGSNLYWGSGTAIWNNTGDTATLRLSNGQVVDTCTYGGGGTGTNCN